MAALRKLPRIFGALFVILLLVAGLAHTAIFTAMGRFLVRDDGPVRADAVIVLAGDYNGDRVMKGCELVKAGVAPIALVSGPMAFYGINEGELSVNFAIRKGCPANLLEAVKIKAFSTEEEAREFQKLLPGRQIRSVVIVTSNFHTARARRTFVKRFGDTLRIHMSPATTEFFTPETWWHSREGQKIMYFELSKTIAAAIGL